MVIPIFIKPCFALSIFSFSIWHSCYAHKKEIKILSIKMYQTQIHYISNARFNSYCVCANCWTKSYFLLCSQWMKSLFSVQLLWSEHFYFQQVLVCLDKYSNSISGARGCGCLSKRELLYMDTHMQSTQRRQAHKYKSKWIFSKFLKFVGA